MCIRDRDGVDWLYIILNDFLKQEKIPDDLKESEIVAIYKQKGDILECGNYRGIKLLEIAQKIYERVIERRIRERIKTETLCKCSLRMPISLVSCPGKAQLTLSSFCDRYRKRFWKEIIRDIGHLWIWRRPLIEYQGKCCTGA